MKTQLKDSQGDQTTRGHELLHLRAQVRQYQQEIDRRRAEINSLHDLVTQLRRENVDLRAAADKSQLSRTQEEETSKALSEAQSQIESLRLEREQQNAVFQEDKARWMEEKDRVIKYQKQLHHNYVSMLNRNRQLEEEVARLTGVPLPPTNDTSLPPISSTLSSSYSDVREKASTDTRC